MKILKEIIGVLINLATLLGDDIERGNAFDEHFSTYKGEKYFKYGFKHR